MSERLQALAEAWEHRARERFEASQNEHSEDGRRRSQWAANIYAACATELRTVLRES